MMGSGQTSKFYIERLAVGNLTLWWDTGQTSKFYIKRLAVGNLTLWWDTGQTSKFYMRDWQWEILLYGGMRGKQVSFI